MSPRTAQSHDTALFGKPRVNDVCVVDQEVFEVVDGAAMRLPVNLDGNDSPLDTCFRHVRMKRFATAHRLIFPAIKITCTAQRLFRGRNNIRSFNFSVHRKLRIAAGRPS